MYGDGLPLTLVISHQMFWLMLKPSSVIARSEVVREIGSS